MSSNIKTDNRAILRRAALVTCLACLVAVSVAYAEDDPRSETVKFTDLNVSTQAGAEALYARIHAAARRVCDQPPGEEAAIGPCMRKTENETIAKISIPLLTAFYQRKTGDHPPTITASR
jgi:UrcA family protein